MKFFQRLGKSLMLPVCVLPICGILMGIGYALCPSSMQGGEIVGFSNTLGFLLVKTGGAIIDNIAVLFAIGVAVGMSDDGHGTSALAGIVSWLIITNLLSVDIMSVIYGELEKDSTVYIAFSKIRNPTIGIIAGIIGSSCYNRFKGIKLPDFLAFFSGRRFVAIATVGASLIVTVCLSIVWPACYAVMIGFSKLIASCGGIGAGIYAFLNRLLIPTGMHHAINSIFWFDTIGLGDLTYYWLGKTSAQVGWDLGMYMSGFFPCMIGGIPGAALAIYHHSKNRKKAFGLLSSSVICAVLCGLSEPFEFSFMFACFPLYVIYSLLYGLFTVITYYVKFRAGFSFSAGITDLIFSSRLPAANKTWMIIPLSLAAFAVFYLVFRFAVRFFKLQLFDSEETEKQKKSEPANDNARYMTKARGILQAVGGKLNVTGCDCCATRLRLELKDSSVVNRELAKKWGAIDVVFTSPTSCQVIIGLTVQQFLESFRKVLEEPENIEKTIDGKPVSHGELLKIRIAKPRAKSGSVKKEDSGFFTFKYVIKDACGIHARPAGRIAQIVKDNGADVVVEAEGKTANGCSPVALMGLGIKCGTEITVKVNENSENADSTANELYRFFSENL